MMIRELSKNKLIQAFGSNIGAIVLSLAVFQLFIQPQLFAQGAQYEIFNKVYYLSAILSGMVGTVALYQSVGKTSRYYALLYFGLTALCTCGFLYFYKGSEVFFFVAFFLFDFVITFFRRCRKDHVVSVLIIGESVFLLTLILIGFDILLSYIAVKLLISLGCVLWAMVSGQIFVAQPQANGENVGGLFLFQNVARFAEKHIDKIVFLYIYPVPKDIFPYIVVTGLISLPINLIAKIFVGHQVKFSLSLKKILLGLSLIFVPSLVGCLTVLYYLYGLSDYKILLFALALRSCMSLAQLIYANKLSFRRKSTYYALCLFPALIGILYIGRYVDLYQMMLLLVGYFLVQTFVDHKYVQSRH